MCLLIFHNWWNEKSKQKRLEQSEHGMSCSIGSWNKRCTTSPSRISLRTHIENQLNESTWHRHDDQHATWSLSSQIYLWWTHEGGNITWSVDIQMLFVLLDSIEFLWIFMLALSLFTHLLTANPSGFRNNFSDKTVTYVPCIIFHVVDPEKLHSRDLPAWPEVETYKNYSRSEVELNEACAWCVDFKLGFKQASISCLWKNSKLQISWRQKLSHRKMFELSLKLFVSGTATVFSVHRWTKTGR